MNLHIKSSDFMFCQICGTHLLMRSSAIIVCPSCKFEKNARDSSTKEIGYYVSAEELRKELGISRYDGQVEIKDMEIIKRCEKCNNTKLKFSTRQMRSADEGQTIFFYCPSCNHQFTEN